MASRKFKRYNLENSAKMLISAGVLLLLFSWLAGLYYFQSTGITKMFLVPFIFTCISALLLLMIRYRYALFERYPYLVSLPSLFYRIEKKKQAIAFSMIFTVHSLGVAFIGLMSLLLTISIGSGIKDSAASPFLYLYLLVVALLVVSALLLYRRIYHRFAK